jgi:hypothetical protein
MQHGLATETLMLTLLLLPVAAAAQQPASSLDDLLRSGELRPGDDVYITDATGHRLPANVTDVSPSLLAVTDGRDTWAVAEIDISKIERRDSLQNGIWIGIAAGIGTLIAACNSRGGWHGRRRQRGRGGTTKRSKRRTQVRPPPGRPISTEAGG